MHPSGSTVTLGGTNVLSGATSVTGTLDTSGVAFSTALTGNPLQQMHYESVTTASANAGKVLLASATGKTIYVGGGVSIYASGTASGATSVSLECSGGSIIVTWPRAMLVDDLPVGAFSSTVVTRGTPLVEGCPSGEAVMISSTGTLVSTTDLRLNIPYGVSR
jgi:hypothetical protein